MTTERDAISTTTKVELEALRAQIESLKEELNEIREQIKGPSLHPDVTGVSIIDDIRDMQRDCNSMKAQLASKDKEIEGWHKLHDTFVETHDGSKPEPQFLEDVFCHIEEESERKERLLQDASTACGKCDLDQIGNVVRALRGEAAQKELLLLQAKEALEDYDKALVLAISIIKCKENISDQAAKMFLDAMKGKEALAALAAHLSQGGIGVPPGREKAIDEVIQAARSAKDKLQSANAIPYYAYGDNEAANEMKTAIMDSLTVISDTLSKLDDLGGGLRREDK